MSILSDQDIKNFLNKEIVIYPFNEECISPLGYDLRIGHSIHLTTEHQNAIKKVGEISIPANTSTLIYSEEHIYLSNKIAGTLHARGSLAAKGLFINSTTVDPNWYGPLTFLIHNINDYPVELQEGSRFVTLIFHKVNTPTISSPNSDPKIVAERYGNIYGEYFSKSALNYLTSQDNSSVGKEFSAYMQKAKEPTPSEIILRFKSYLLNSFKKFIQNDLIKFVPKILLIIPIGLMIVGFTAHFYWNSLQLALNLNTPYSVNIFIWQFTLIAVGATLFMTIINFIKSK
jgi:deoxycytidine triphosphate deaminase